MAHEKAIQILGQKETQEKQIVFELTQTEMCILLLPTAHSGKANEGRDVGRALRDLASVRTRS